MYIHREIDGTISYPEPRRHEPSRIFPALPQSPPDFNEQLQVEADTTRWWLQERNQWNNKELVITKRVYDSETDDAKTVAVYPIPCTLVGPDGQGFASYYLGFDAKIYAAVEDHLMEINTEDDVMTNEIFYLCKQLRKMRKK
ncbi:MAG TPA: hypothetical protein VGO98_03175 [Candidatus Saccharimonadales bacterium]|nr:hypothetical protein [Candidatus Saccharimonadales bacterium]